MKTDSLFYKIFAAVPSIFFELIGQPPSPNHRFDSIEVKQTAFRIDGVFLPGPTASDRAVYFTEVQFQADETLYHRLFAEIALFLKHHPQTQEWRAIVIFARRSLEPPESPAYRPFLDLPNVSRFYLDEPPAAKSFAWKLMSLITGPAGEVPAQARQLLQEARCLPPKLSQQRVLIELIETILVYKFPQLSREEIAKMLDIAAEASQTRVFQEGRAEGRAEGRTEEGRTLILKLLKHKFGEVSPDLAARIESLALEKLEALAAVLLDAATIADLQAWLDGNATE